MGNLGIGKEGCDFSLIRLLQCIAVQLDTLECRRYTLWGDCGIYKILRLRTMNCSFLLDCYKLETQLAFKSWITEENFDFPVLVCVLRFVRFLLLLFELTITMHDVLADRSIAKLGKRKFSSSQQDDDSQGAKRMKNSGMLLSKV